MTCPYCGGPHDPAKAGRFCGQCGRSVGPPQKQSTPAGPKDKSLTRCAECARIIGEAPRCQFCGARQRHGELP